MFRRPLFITMFFPLIVFPMMLAATTAKGSDAHDNALATFNYDIFVEGEDIGDMQVQMIEKPKGGYQILESTLIEVNSDWDSKNLRTTANEWYSFEHDLISADKKTYEQTRPHWSRIESFGSDLWMSVSEIENQVQKDEQELLGLSLAVLSNIIPVAGEAIGLSQLLFSDKKVVPKSIRVPKHSHHTTLTHLPKYWSTQQQTLPAKINLLDIETISIASMDIQYQGLEIKMLSGTKVLTHHYTLTSKSRAPLNIWLAINDNNIAYFFELEVEDESGVFTMKLNNINP